MLAQWACSMFTLSAVFSSTMHTLSSNHYSINTDWFILFPHLGQELYPRLRKWSHVSIYWNCFLTRVKINNGVNDLEVHQHMWHKISADKMAADGPKEYSSLEGADAWDLRVSRWYRWRWVGGIFWVWLDFGDSVMIHLVYLGNMFTF